MEIDLTTRIIEALDPCRSDLTDLASNDVGAPVFGEPWHAQVFGLSMALAQAGRFSWATWVDTFSAEIRANPQTTEETSEAAYYRQWAAALTTLLDQIGAANAREMDDTVEHWRRSYLATEHGKPIEFRRDLPEPKSDHDHHHHHAHNGCGPAMPVAVCAAK